MATTNARRVKDGRFFLHGVNKGFRGEGSAPLFTRAPQLFDHFTDNAGLSTNFAAVGITAGQVSGTRYTLTVTGTGTQSAASISKTASGGVLNLASSLAFADQCAELAGTGIFWEAEELAGQQRMLFEARVRIPVLTARQAFWGFSDVLTAAVKTGAIFNIATNSTATLGTNNAAMFGYSSLPTSGALDITGTTTNYLGFFSSVTGTTTAYVASTGIAADALFHIYSIYADSAGNCDLFIDDKFVGYVQYVAASGKGLNPAVAFTPYFTVFNTTTSTASIDIDYVLTATTMETGV